MWFHKFLIFSIFLGGILKKCLTIDMRGPNSLGSYAFHFFIFKIESGVIIMKKENKFLKIIILLLLLILVLLIFKI